MCIHMSRAPSSLAGSCQVLLFDLWILVDPLGAPCCRSHGHPLKGWVGHTSSRTILVIWLQYSSHVTRKPWHPTTPKGLWGGHLGHQA